MTAKTWSHTIIWYHFRYGDAVSQVWAGLLLRRADALLTTDADSGLPPPILGLRPAGMLILLRIITLSARV